MPKRFVIGVLAFGLMLDALFLVSPVHAGGPGVYLPHDKLYCDTSEKLITVLKKDGLLEDGCGLIRSHRGTLIEVEPQGAIPVPNAPTMYVYHMYVMRGRHILLEGYIALLDDPD
jgi:hypothetical protein